MVRRPVWRLSVAALFAASFVLACASTPQEEEGQTNLGGSGSSDGTGWEEPGGTSGATTPGSGAMQSGTASGAVVGMQNAETQQLQMELKPVYFDYDRSTLRPDAAATLKANAEAIRNFPSWAVVTVEGNCDERGTEEYNLALGDRRADAVKRYLVTLGVPESRLRTVSYGELKPAVQGHDETAWSQNRRAEFQVSR